jgi:ribosomal protein S12 methylthiotransferase
LLTEGFILTNDCRDADLIIINTCSFIEEAQQESVNTLLQTAKDLKGTGAYLVVAGCLVEIYGTKILKNIPDIDGAIGVHSYRHLKKFLSMVFTGLRVTLKCSPTPLYSTLFSRILTTPPHSVCVKIAEGCSNRCSYCLIPKIRGPYRSRDPQEINDEIGHLLKNGTREIVLIAQDTTAYGSDRIDYPDLSGLISLILDREDKFWLRIMYTYPSRIKENLVQQMAEDRRICRYLDLPIQHSSDRILTLMNRSYRQQELKILIDKLRVKIPDIALRTTCMVGFPGEKKSDYEILLDDLAALKFDRLGAFAFSLQKETAACRLPGIISSRIAKRRLKKLMLSQQAISLALNKKLIGKRITVLIEEQKNPGKNWYYGRTEFQAPEVDGRVLVYSGHPLNPGDWATVGIAAVSTYNLLAINTVPLPELPV